MTAAQYAVVTETYKNIGIDADNEYVMPKTRLATEKNDLVEAAVAASENTADSTVTSDIYVVATTDETGLRRFTIWPMTCSGVLPTTTSTSEPIRRITELGFDAGTDGPANQVTKA